MEDAGRELRLQNTLERVIVELLFPRMQGMNEKDFQLVKDAVAEVGMEEHDAYVKEMLQREPKP